MIKPSVLPLLFFCLASLLSCKDKRESSVKERKDNAFQYYQQAKEVEDIEEKLRLLSRANAAVKDSQDSLLQNIWDHKIYYFDRLKSYDSSKHYANLMIENGILRQDTSQIALGFYRRGRIRLYQNDHLGVLEDMFQSQKYYLLSGDSTAAGKRLVELGIAQYRLGDFSGSQVSQIEALKLLRHSGDSIYLSRIYNNLAMTYRQLKDLDEALDEYSNALKVVNSRQDSLSVLNNIANTYNEKEEYEKSLAIFDSILPLAKDLKTINRIKDNYYFTRWLQEKAEVKDSLQNLMESRRQEDDLEGLLSSYQHLTQILIEEDAQEAYEYAEKYYRTARMLKSVSDEINALGFLIHLSPPEDNKQYSLEYLRLSDSLIHARDKVKNMFAKIKYDEEQKLEEIYDLETLNSIQKLELLQERNRRNLAVFAGLLLLIAAFYVYYFLQQRHKKETLREIHDTEARISKKIHDELANDIYNVMTELEDPSRLRKDETLNKLESIYFRTRNISRENTPVNTGPGFAEDLQYMLSHSTPPYARLFLTGFQDISWGKINPEVKIVVYRVLQELMVNMNKHSEASIIGINFKRTASKLSIKYVDNGRGISPEELKKGSGLKNVENRIVSIEGTFNFLPVKDKGFSADILIPA